ncbi:hypothetical protein [Priestia megaterium]|uniref:hypothetical protein n=1 Tax=Priestia megaterium TaxID=1404 RepID=UPI0039F661FF
MGWHFYDECGYMINGKVIEFMMFFYQNSNTPQRIEHYFKGICPYCENDVKRNSICPLNARHDGDIMKLWRMVNLRNLMDDKPTNR